MKPFPRIHDFGLGPPLILLHGWSADADYFSRQSPLAGEGIRLIAPDFPGHGPRAIPRSDLDIDDLAEAVATLIASLDGERAVLAGWSMGAAVALRYLQHHGTAHVRGLAIIDMSPKVANDAEWRLGLSNGQSAVDMKRNAGDFALHWQAIAPFTARALFATGVEPDPLRLETFESSIAGNDGPTMASLWRALADVDDRKILSELDLPIRVILGAGSAVYGRDLATWYGRLRGDVTVEVIENAGHAPQIDDPVRVNAILAGLMRDAPGRRMRRASA